MPALFRIGGGIGELAVETRYNRAASSRRSARLVNFSVLHLLMEDGK